MHLRSKLLCLWVMMCSLMTLPGCAQTSSDATVAKNLLVQCGNRCAALRAVEYTSRYRIKSMYVPDTLDGTGVVSFARSGGDGVRLRVSSMGHDTYFTGDTLYLISSLEEEIEIVTAQDNPYEEYESMFPSRLATDVFLNLHKHFSKYPNPSHFLSACLRNVKSGQFQVRVQDTTETWVVTIDHGKGDFDRVTISKKDTLPVRYESLLKKDGGVQFVCNEFSDIRTDSTFSQPISFHAGNYPGYRTRYFTKPTEHRAVKIGDRLVWNGVRVDGKQVSSRDFEGKRVLYDFWFIGCSPCTKAIPLCNALKLEGVFVVGVNPLNRKPEAVQRHAREHGMQYESVLIERETAAANNLGPYPTFLVTDEAGTVVYVHIGYEEKDRNSIYNDILRAYKGAGGEKK